MVAHQLVGGVRLVMPVVGARESWQTWADEETLHLEMGFGQEMKSWVAVVETCYLNEMKPHW